MALEWANNEVKREGEWKARTQVETKFETKAWKGLIENIEKCDFQDGL